jgi:hypothetical protein
MCWLCGPMCKNIHCLHEKKTMKKGYLYPGAAKLEMISASLCPAACQWEAQSLGLCWFGSVVFC